MHIIPGAWEPRPATVAAAAPLAGPAQTRVTGNKQEVAAPAPRRELPAALNVVIAAAVLLAAMWLVMIVF
jgi:hypothetical protein